MLVIVGFVLPPFTATSERPTVLGDVLFSLLLLSGIGTVWSEGRLAFRIIATITLCALAVHWLTRFAPAKSCAIWDAGANIVTLASLALVVLAKVLRPGTVTGHRIKGAVAVYLLLGFVWASAYQWIALNHPGAFSGAGAGDPLRVSWVYYSFVTLTTTGYGDITPVLPGARSLAMSEALTGQLYLAILISRLVALELSARRDA